MSYIDLMKLINEHGTIQGDVYGYIDRALPRPDNIRPDVVVPENCVFVCVNIFCVDLSKYKSQLGARGIRAEDNLFFANGSLCTLVESNIKIPDWYTFPASLMRGTKKESNYVVSLDYKKDNNGKWHINPVKCRDFESQNWNEGSILYEYINYSAYDGNVVLPKSVSNIPPISCVMDSMYETPGVKFGSVQLDSVEEVNDTEQKVIKHKYESRQTIADFSEYYNTLNEALVEASNKLSIFTTNIASMYSYTGEVDSNMEYLFNAINRSMKKKPRQKGTTGRGLLRDYFAKFKKSKREYLGTTAAEALKENFDAVIDYMKTGERNTFTGIADKLLVEAFSEPESVYAYLLGKIVGVEGLIGVEEFLRENGISFSKVVTGNPYVLCLMAGVSYKSSFEIAHAVGHHEASFLQYLVNIENFVKVSGGNTAYEVKSVYGANMGVRLTANERRLVAEKGTYMSDKCITDIEYYLGKTKTDWEITQPLSKVGADFIVGRPSRVQIEQALKEYENHGLGVILDDIVYPTKYLKKELFVYKTMYDIGNTETGFDSSEIDTIIDEYEGVVGFKLESEQRNSVHLLCKGGGCIAGSAGSGKTTSCDAFVYVLRRLDSSVRIKFAAPTGKASKRLQEVVKTPVKTMHSMFCIGRPTDSFLVEEDEFEMGNRVIYIFDECAMVTIDMLYTILSRVNNCCIYMFGDPSQLSPIGKGLPFKNLLGFMPTTVLRVSKRAADGSKITYNSNVLNECSDGENWADFENGDDFKRINCDNDDIRSMVGDLCKHYLGKLTEKESDALKRHARLDELPVVANLSPDDIQVVTPLAKASYNWGTNALNKELQPIFNTTRGGLNCFLTHPFKQKYFLNDRVISTDNLYGMQWYRSVDNGVMQKTYGCGIINGDIGKIYKVYKADEVVIEEEMGNPPKGFEYHDRLRDDSSYQYNDNGYFIIVKYYDYLSDSDFYIAYRAEMKDADNETNLTVYAGDDLSSIALFYAGTTHKLQGSQAKLIISVIGSMPYAGYSKFMSRNMIYTMWTRGVDLVITVGSVSDSDSSQLTCSRSIVCDEGVLTVGEILNGSTRDI